jgi:hypothetical protein
LDDFVVVKRNASVGRVGGVALYGQRVFSFRFLEAAGHCINEHNGDLRGWC